MTLALFGIAAGLALLAGWMQHLADVAARRVADGLRVEAERRRAILEEVMFQTHHDISRELMLLAFAIDDKEEDGVDVAELVESLANLETSRDMIAVLAQLGGAQHINAQPVDAEDLVPRSTIPIHAHTIAPVVGDPRLLRTAVMAGVTYFERVHGATEVRVVCESNRIRMDVECGEADAMWSLDTENPLSLANRIIEAHGGELDVQRTESGWACAAILPDTPVDDIVVAPSREETRVVVAG